MRRAKSSRPNCGSIRVERLRPAIRHWSRIRQPPVFQISINPIDSHVVFTGRNLEVPPMKVGRTCRSASVSRERVKRRANATPLMVLSGCARLHCPAQICFAHIRRQSYFLNRLVRWCNGSTRPFGGFCHGSNPCRTASLIGNLWRTIPTESAQKKRKRPTPKTLKAGSVATLRSLSLRNGTRNENSLLVNYLSFLHGTFWIIQIHYQTNHRRGFFTVRAWSSA
jgi:hypothetical protein